MKLKKKFNGLFDVYSPSPKITKLVDKISQTKIPTMSDADGLSKAYEQPNKIFINNNKMYIAGTSSLQDVWDDLKIPFHLTKYSKRYEDAEKILKENPQVDNMIGHSLGGAVVLELNKNNNNKFDTTTYGSPTFQLDDKNKGKRYRHTLDPISMFDRGANTIPLNIEDLLHPFSTPAIDVIDPLKNHSYQGYANQGDDDEGNIGNKFSYSRK